MMQVSPVEALASKTALPLNYQPVMMQNYQSDLDKGFDIDDIQILTKYKLSPPSQILTASVEGDLNKAEYDDAIGQKLIELGREKRNVDYKKKQKNC